jgi:hypothetical protein
MPNQIGVSMRLSSWWSQKSQGLPFFLYFTTLSMSISSGWENINMDHTLKDCANMRISNEMTPKQFRVGETLFFMLPT